MPKYTFQPSMIFEAGNPVAKDQPTHTVKMPKNKGEAAARRKLPKVSVGREWVLVAIDGRPTDPVEIARLERAEAEEAAFAAAEARKRALTRIRPAEGSLGAIFSRRRA